MIVRRILVFIFLMLALISAGPLGAALSDRDAAMPRRPHGSVLTTTAKINVTRLCQRALAASTGCIIDKTIIRTAVMPRSARTDDKLQAADSRIPSGVTSAPMLRPPRLA
ncbi:MAG: hypothetical protein CML29_01500 [Rhizobiales bacterium]|mgnify:CR=1 FL=1|nr:hypothetical protein [Hyphomicrobiales bacterium]MBA68079.1 hypothetical protein [Hyphomicrobiales bacterium]|tara:strand:- start:92 stop:421 length:330 start_codon:yes stop_codon:yes gene_type:complete